MTINTATATREDIKSADTADLVSFYNDYAAKNGMKPVKKFVNRSTAESRVWKLIQSLPPENEAKTSKKEKKAAAPKKREILESKIIKVLKQENPKRPGSRAFEKFSVLLRMDGRPIRDLKAQEGRHPKLDMEEGWAATELRWAQKLGLVKLVNA